MLLPIFPERVIVVKLPAHNVDSVAEAVPPTLIGSTVTLVTLEFAAEQTPLVTTAR